MDALESLSPPSAVIFLVNLQEEHSINLSAGSAKTFSECSSPGTNYLGRSHNRNKRTKSAKNSSNASLRSYVVLDNYSGQACDSLNTITSGVLVSDVSKVGKSLRRSSRKKGKKKGKQYKQCMHNKVSVELESRCKDIVSGSSFFVTSVNSEPACLSEHILESSLSKKAASFSVPVKDITTEVDNTVYDDYIDSSTTSVPCTSYSNRMDEYELITSFSQGFSGEEISCNSTTYITNTLGTSQTPEIILSSFDKNTDDVHLKKKCNNCCYNSSINSSYIAPVLDLIPGVWNSGISENCSDDVEGRLFINDEDRLNSSKGGVISDPRSPDTLFRRTTVSTCDTNTELSKDCYLRSPCWSDVDVNTLNDTERVPCSSNACSSSEFHPVISGKRGRLARKVTRNLNRTNQFVSANIHGCTRKDNNLYIWQKVQKMSSEECICEPTNADNVLPQVDSSSKGSKAWVRLDTSMRRKQNQSGENCRYPCSDKVVSQTCKTGAFKVACNADDSSENCSKSVDGNSIDDVRSKPSSASKKTNHYSRKGSCAGKSNMVRPSQIHVPHKEGFGILPLVKQSKHISTGLSSHCTTDSQQLVVKLADKIDCRQSELQKQTRILMEEATLPRNICSRAYDTTSPAAYNQMGPSPTVLGSLSQTQIEVLSDSSNVKYYEDIDRYFCATGSEDKRCMKSEAECSHVECSKLDNGFVQELQKWVSVGGKDSVLLKKSHIDDLSVSSVDESASNKSDLKNGEVESLSSNTHNFVSLTGPGLPWLNPGSGGIHCSSPKVAELTSELRSQPHTAGECGDVLALSRRHLTYEKKNQAFSGFETDLDKIIQAVTDAYKLQTAAEGVHLAGSPFVDFERLIHNVSPVIGQIYCINSCNTCSREELIGNSLCWHQIPSISLGSLWQWYEEPGCYGMEVKVEDCCNSKSLRNGFQFRAYFVPFLSAVQLFGRSGSTNNGSLRGGATITCEVDKTSKASSYLGSLPIFAKLLSQPCKEVDACFLDSSSSKVEISNRPVRSKCLGGEELIFEYFESKQPHQRRPLFEKIKELVRGTALKSDCQLFGDPLKLECMNLHDLHPASWYSVAWYPIYRIPDGNFHAAFLTYHSFGHFVHQNTSSNMPGHQAHIVSPVVGLQSYNTKGESWFQPRGSKLKAVQTEGSSSMSPSKVLEEWLRKLERTACVMATASVCKGDQRSVNKQLDYEFFSQRRCWSLNPCAKYAFLELQINNSIGLYCGSS